MSHYKGPVYFVMGVSGCGKSTIGKQLAEALKMPFFDGDDYHPPSNVSKMASGQPLNDDDRQEWLRALNKLAIANQNQGAIIVCSALKASYRTVLSSEITDKVSWILLEGTFEEIQKRLNARKGHFMPASLLKSQFQTLELPTHAIAVSITPSPEVIVHNILLQIRQ